MQRIVPRRPSDALDTLLYEIDATEIDRRFAACQALESSIWAYGISGCNSAYERQQWQIRYAEHLEKMSRAWQYTRTRAQKRDPLTERAQ